MAIFEGNRYAISSQIIQPVQWVSRKAGLGLFAVRDNRRTGRFEAFYRFLDCTFEKAIQRGGIYLAGCELLHRLLQLGWAWNAADGFGWNGHCNFLLLMISRVAADGP